MSMWWMVAGAILVSMVWAWYRGNRIVKAQGRLLDETTRIENIPDKDVYTLTYHGGIPEMPKAQKLNIALTNEYLLFFNDKGDKQKVYFESCNKVDRFVNRHEPDMKGRSVVLWGPLIGIFFKVKYRYYIVIDYIDQTNNNNNILLECQEDKHKALYEALKKRHTNYRRELKNTAKSS